MNNGSDSDNFKTAIFADCLANSQEIFQLIDRLFPIDSCRHYQVLPLKLTDNDLLVGMLDPDNEEERKFVNSIAKVFRYNLSIQLIDIQTHQIILASYPQSSSPTKKSEQDYSKTVIDTSFNPNFNRSSSSNNSRKIVDSAPTIISQPEDVTPKSSVPQELPDLPPDLDFLKDLDLTPHSPKKSPKPKIEDTATVYEIPPEFLNQKSNNLDDKATIIGGNPAQFLAQESQSESEIAFTEAQISELTPETPDKSLAETADFLPQLKPDLSWQKLLEQAFRNQTDDIILTRYSDRGSIVAVKDGLTQSRIEQLSLPVFCSLIDEIKRMARLPQDTVTHPRKVVLEKFYQQERTLLRLEFSLQQGIEKVRVQILRNQALKIYEQQQMDKVSEQALQLAKQLEKSLRRIQACFDSAELTNLEEIQAVQSRINHQLRLLDR